ncbi:phage tail protein [Salinispora arenicola]|uniref:phage tail tape measure protein n=2 Tax=Salinispora arenicola TaxID=168697 RepID=UPI00168DC799|nr:phage tail tape measure protein [Salinispora arenicola]NIL56708.1 phage tail protein [Salinispora arenicola]
MALRLGELATILTTDRRPLKQGLSQAEGDVRDSGRRMVQTGARSGQEVGRNTGEGVIAKLGPALKGGVLVVGAAAGALLGTAIIGALDLSQAQAKLTAQIGNAEYAQELGKVAGRLYGRGFAGSVGEAMEAVRSVTSSGLLSEDATNAEIEAVTRKVQGLAEAFDLDLVQASRAAGQMIRNGLAADADEALDLIARGFQPTGDQAGDLLDSFSEYSTQFRKLGLSAVDAMGLMSQGVEAGARDMDTVADALKEFAARSADGSKASAEGFGAIGLNASKMTKIFATGGPQARDALGMVLDKIRAMKDPTDREAAAVALFGTKAEDLQAALLGMDLSAAETQLGNVGGAAEKMADALEQSAGRKVEAFKRRATMQLTELGGRIIGWATQVAQHPDVREFMAGAQKFLSDRVIPALRLFWGWIRDKIIPVLLEIREKAIETLMDKLGDLQRTMDENQDELRTFGNTIKTVAEWIVSNVFPVLSSLYTVYLSRLIDGVRLVIWWISAWVDAFSTLRSAATGTASWVDAKIDWIANKANALRKRLSFSGLFDGIKSAFRSALNWVIGRWNNLSFGIPSVTFFGQTVGGGRVGTPNIPYLAKGGIIPATPGGRLVVAGEAGQDEAVIPLPRGARSLGTPQRGGHAELLLTGELRVRGGDLVLVLREQVALRGGDVQEVIGSDQ